MSGLVKAKKYDWKDSNLALFGSDTEKQVKKDSAKTEPAWKNAGERPGIQIWRIRKFKVVHEQKEEYGKFYNGDSYIVLNTYRKPESEELFHDVHFWIGQYSTQDEYGTAAYKTVEVDTYLDDKPVQHREVMNHESDLFKSYFEHITLLKGGFQSGFRHVKPEEYELRLLQVKGDKKKVTIKEVPPYKSVLEKSSGDVFIIDNGLEIIQWNGEGCNKDEKFKAVQYLQTLKSDRFGKPKVKSFDGPLTERIMELLKDGEPPADEDDEEDDSDSFSPKLLRLSDEDGKLAMTLVSEGSIPKDQLRSEDVFIADTGKELFVWVGRGASEGEKKNGLTYAHNYLMKTQHPLIPVTVLKEGDENEVFQKILN
ncbi:gelsolin-like protein 2 [Xenia sp. Carnegie-2017]|uniref:gelsolin-like protein 2 n=1 Tax=Xenia sp. Carnegie-2017 TaxID=2897299 RepID=UPI001F034456|nr:gelsolin-like protein 2 [Xenia sp. Carnegie-2017]